MLAISSLSRRGHLNLAQTASLAPYLLLALGVRPDVRMYITEHTMATTISTSGTNAESSDTNLLSESQFFTLLHMSSRASPRRLKRILPLNVNWYDLAMGQSHDNAAHSKELYLC